MKRVAGFIGAICFVLLLSGCISPQKEHSSIRSPNGRNRVSAFVEQGQLYYAVERDGNTLLAPSRLGLRFKTHTPLGENVRIVAAETNSFNECWEQVWGEQQWVTNHYEELLLTLAENGGEQKMLNVRIRVYDDGVGFRYEVPEQSGMDEVAIMDEITEFHFPAEGTAWWTPGNSCFYEQLARVTPICEVGALKHEMEVGYGGVAPDKARPANTPITIKTAEECYLTIHEAALLDYAAMNLSSSSSTTLRCELTPWSTGEKVFATVPFVSPWRMMIIGDRPGDLITSRLELNLNEPCKINDTSWIETGKYIGIWWAIHLRNYTWGAGPKHGATTENTMRYMDFAAEHGFKGVLVEGWNEGWKPGWMNRLDNFSFTKAYPDFDIEKVCTYGLSKGVRLIGHHETGGAIANYEAQLDDAFALYQSNGVRAVKTGYVGRRASDMREMMDAKELNTSQFGVRHFQKVLEIAAKYHLMVISHESIMQTGLRRTWPNMMASENLRGQEYNAWSADGGNPPEHLATIPFTRGLAGPIDFTPGIVNFDYERVPGTRVQTTVAKQLSLYVVLYSPWQMAADLPENYEGHPALKFIEHVPTNWETTQVLDGEIGDFITVARKDRSSEDWYVGSLTDENPRDVHIPLKFLDAGCRYTAEIYRDGPNADWKTNPESLVVESRTVTAGDTLDIHLAASGGLAVRLVPQK